MSCHTALAGSKSAFVSAARTLPAMARQPRCSRIHVDLRRSALSRLGCGRTMHPPRRVAADREAGHGQGDGVIREAVEVRALLRVDRRAEAGSSTRSTGSSASPRRAYSLWSKAQPREGGGADPIGSNPAKWKAEVDRADRRAMGRRLRWCANGGGAARSCRQHSTPGPKHVLSFPNWTARTAMPCCGGFRPPRGPRHDLVGSRHSWRCWHEARRSTTERRERRERRFRVGSWVSVLTHSSRWRG